MKKSAEWGMTTALMYKAGEEHVCKKLFEVSGKQGPDTRRVPLGPGANPGEGPDRVNTGEVRVAQHLHRGNEHVMRKRARDVE